MKFDVGDQLRHVREDLKRTILGVSDIRGSEYWVMADGWGSPQSLAASYVESEYALDVPRFEVGKKYHRPDSTRTYTVLEVSEDGQRAAASVVHGGLLYGATLYGATLAGPRLFEEVTE